MYVESKVELNLPKSKILNLIRQPDRINLVLIDGFPNRYK